MEEASIISNENAEEKNSDSRYEFKLHKLKNNYPDSVNSLFFIDDVGPSTNRKLHTAIALNATKSALKLIEQSTSDINKVSYGNTPLLLALKKGNRIVAKKLLEQEGLLLDVLDDYKYSALQYASMLRMDDIIQLLINKGATKDNRYTGGSFYNFECVPAAIAPTHLKELYEINVMPATFNFHLDLHNERSKHIEMDIQEKHNLRYYFFKTIEKDISGRSHLDILSKKYFSDNKELEIKFLHPYTFLIFHIADIMHNMNWMTPEILEKISASQKTSRSDDKFSHAFDATYKHFCEMRNKTPISEEIVKLIDDMENINVFDLDYEESRVLKI